MPAAEIDLLDAPVQVAAPTKQKRIHALSSRFQELDGLRGMAALVVVLFHYLAGPAIYSHTASRIREILYVSPLSVDMFFILSGFLVGGILLNTKRSPNYYSTFYMRRLYRVLPIYFLWAFGFVLLALCIPSVRDEMIPSGYTLSAFVAAHMLFVQNFPHFPVFAARAQWFGTTWTLAIEEHFYLIVPFCLYRFSRRRLIIALSAIIALAPLFRMFAWQVLNLRDPMGITYFWTPFRADGLAIGVLLAILWERVEVKEWLRQRANWIYFSLAMSSLLALVLDYMTVKHVRYADVLFAGVGRSAIELTGLCTILIALIFQGQSNVAFMRWGWAREIGKISYFLYLAHRGILWMVLRFGLHTTAGASVQSDIVAGVTGFVLTCCLAALSWKYFEGPLQRKGHRFVY